MEKILGRAVSRQEITQLLVRDFGDVFGLEMREMSHRELQAWLQTQELPSDAKASTHAIEAWSQKLDVVVTSTERG